MKTTSTQIRYGDSTDDRSTWATVFAEVTGPWGIHRSLAVALGAPDAPKRNIYTVTHLPSGYSIRQGLSLRVARILVARIGAEVVDHVGAWAAKIDPWSFPLPPAKTTVAFQLVGQLAARPEAPLPCGAWDLAKQIEQEAPRVH